MNGAAMRRAIVLRPGRYMGAIRRQVECEAATITETSYDSEAGGGIPAHRHSRPYFLFLVRGGYAEASRLGHRTLSAGRAFYHPTDLVHRSRVIGSDARILNVELSDTWLTA